MSDSALVFIIRSTCTLVWYVEVFVGADTAVGLQPSFPNKTRSQPGTQLPSHPTPPRSVAYGKENRGDLSLALCGVFSNGESLGDL